MTLVWPVDVAVVQAVVIVVTPRGPRVTNAAAVVKFPRDIRRVRARNPRMRRLFTVRGDTFTFRGWDGRTVVYRMRPRSAEDVFERSITADKVYDDLDIDEVRRG